MLQQLLQGLGSTGLFTSRAFLPALASAAALRWGDQLPFLKDADFIQQVADAPTWFTSDMCLTVLTILSALEIAATKVPEARELLYEFDRYAKAAMAALTYLGVASATDAAFVQSITQDAGVLDTVPAVAVGAATFFFSATRGAVFSAFAEADDDDATGLQGLLSWLEDAWSVAGLLFVILFPLLMIGVIAGIFGLLYLLQKRAEVREEQARIDCASCGQKVYAHAMACPNCHTTVPAPHRIGFFGGSKPEPDTNLDVHPYRLVEKRRCPVCATKLPQRSPRQTCHACGHRLMAEESFAARYLSRIDGRLLLVLPITFGLSFIPVLGLIFGVVYYRIALISPLRRYIPLARNFLLRWFIRILLFVLIVVQVVPVVGGFVVPLMALISYGSYRATFRGMLLRGGSDAVPIASDQGV